MIQHHHRAKFAVDERLAGGHGGRAGGHGGTIVASSNLTLVPPLFNGPTGTREVHTEIRSLNMAGGGAAVRAGTAAASSPKSLGEVQSLSGNSGDPYWDFPAKSFFDIFVQVDIPLGGSLPTITVTNGTPLIVQNSGLTAFPPKVIYVHGNSTAVPVLLASNYPAIGGSCRRHLRHSPAGRARRQFQSEQFQRRGPLPARHRADPRAAGGAAICFVGAGPEDQRQRADEQHHHQLSVEHHGYGKWARWSGGVLRRDGQWRVQSAAVCERQSAERDARSRSARQRSTARPATRAATATLAASR